MRLTSPPRSSVRVETMLSLAVKPVMSAVPRSRSIFALNLALILKKQGVKVFTNAMVQRVEQAGEDLAVHFTCKEKEETVSGEAVLCAIGRRAYCDGLDDREIGVILHAAQALDTGNALRGGDVGELDF